MKYVFIVKSNYHGKHAQGNILGVFSTRLGAQEHFDAVLKDRAKRADIAWRVGAAKEPKDIHQFEWRLAALYVNDPDNAETVELLRHAVSQRKRK